MQYIAAVLMAKSPASVAIKIAITGTLHMWTHCEIDRVIKISIAMGQQDVIQRRSVDVGALSWDGARRTERPIVRSLTMGGGDGERFFIKMKRRY